MKVLLVAPTQSSETVTAVHVARDLADRGHEASFLASPGASRQLPAELRRRTVELTGDLQGNFELWNRTREEVDPDVVLFADYPILAAGNSSTPLGTHRDWVASVEGMTACPMTLDHLGLGQCPGELTLGPIPDGMHSLLPCPMQHPGSVAGRRGDPFRYWELPLGLAGGRREQVRQAYLDGEDELLVVHSVPAWAWQMAGALGLPYYRHLPDILGWYLEATGRRCTVVSVNNGRLLGQPRSASVRVVNRTALPVDAFADLLFSADLVLTENKPSFTIGMAVCGLRPCAALHNSLRFDEVCALPPSPAQELAVAMERERPGAVFPFEVFPMDLTGELDKLWLYRDSALLGAFAEVEIFGGEPARAQLAQLLTDPESQAALLHRQQAYVDLLQRAPRPAELIERTWQAWEATGAP